MMISSLNWVTFIGKFISKSPVLQVHSMGSEMEKLGGKLEEMLEALNLGVNELREKVQALEDRFNLLSKFTIKVSHVVATTLHVLKDR